MYGPCHNWVAFWDHFLNLSHLQADNIILGGDLNFSIGHAKSWGHNAQIDPLSDSMEQLLENHQLIVMQEHPDLASNVKVCSHVVAKQVEFN